MIELLEIDKQFGDVQALSGVNLRVETGSIHGIIGENGAGKSTLMKILTGFISRSSGEIFYKSEKIDLRTPKDARALGIGMLYQEPLDFPQLSVLDNFMAGSSDFSPGKQSLILHDLCNTFGFTLSPKDRVEELTIGERQQLELMRLIRDGAKILVLDEPTSGISEKQQDLLFKALQTLKDEGVSIILVSHKLEEIELLCDEVTVLRRGEVIVNQQRPFDQDSLLQAMFDTLPERQKNTVNAGTDKPILVFKGVVTNVGRSGLRSVSTTINCGEVVGLAGVDGSGQSVFLKSAYGLLLPDSGEISCFNKPLQFSDNWKKKPKVYLPADRLTEGLIPGLTIREHHLLSQNTGPILSSKSGLTTSQQAISTYSIKGSPETEVENLSGGNLQRLLLSLIPPEVKLILMENPTRGLDVQSAAWTWKHLLKRLQPEGAIIFASPDLEEIMEQSTRIMVFYNGTIILDTPTQATSYRELSRAITGHKSN